MNEVQGQLGDFRTVPCFTVTASGMSESSLEAWAIEWLTNRGWRVTSPHDWETPKELCLRLGISSAHLSRSLRKAQCPKPFDLIAGQMGRIVWLKCTKDLEAYLLKFKPNGNRA